ncbi:MAG TPA: hypothetical protein VKR32_17695 [Puia sp.]|nr:hypothetical protein [Puia sp.]
MKIRLKQVALISIIVATVRIVLLILNYFKLGRDLTSPLIPVSLMSEIRHPYVPLGITSIVALIIAIFCFVRTRYTFTIVICIIIFILPNIWNTIR